LAESLLLVVVQAEQTLVLGVTVDLAAEVVVLLAPPVDFLLEEQPYLGKALPVVAVDNQITHMVVAVAAQGKLVVMQVRHFHLTTVMVVTD
jgi:hypothetical protein